MTGYGGSLEGHYSHDDHGWAFTIYIGRLWATPDLFQDVAAGDRTLVKEYLLVDGQPSVLMYDLDVVPQSFTYLIVYDLGTDVVYSIEAWAHLRYQPSALIELARKFMMIR